MATWDDVRRIALALPEVTEVGRDTAAWQVRRKTFVWERPLRGTDIKALGDAAPAGPILGVRVEHVGMKDVLIGDSPHIYFTTPHFDGYPAILVRLGAIGTEELAEITADAWLVQAPKRLAATFRQDMAPE